MIKEDKQIIARAVKENWRTGDRTRLKRLLEKNLKLYRENAELENKIADGKANCDLAIEGRDVKIKELEQELTVEKDQLQEEINLHLHAEEYIKSLETENNKLLDVINNQDIKIADLEKQIIALKAKNIELSENWRADHDTLVFYDEKLEKENAELKGLKDVATLIRANNDAVVTLMQLNNMLVSRTNQLTKATEIIKQLLLLPYANNEEVYADVTSTLNKAEQFLKEIEK